jgi:hypothetical protein
VASYCNGGCDLCICHYFLCFQDQKRRGRIKQVTAKTPEKTSEITERLIFLPKSGLLNRILRKEPIDMLNPIGIKTKKKPTHIVKPIDTDKAVPISNGKTHRLYSFIFSPQ